MAACKPSKFSAARKPDAACARACMCHDQHQIHITSSLTSNGGLPTMHSYARMPVAHTSTFSSYARMPFILSSVRVICGPSWVSDDWFASTCMRASFCYVHQQGRQGVICGFMPGCRQPDQTRARCTSGLPLVRQMLQRACKCVMRQTLACHKPDLAHLRRHVVEGAGAREGQLLVRLDGQPEVPQLERQPCREEDVLRLDVPAAPGGALTAAAQSGNWSSIA